jgi:hypothetical protein
MPRSVQAYLTGKDLATKQSQSGHSISSQLNRLRSQKQRLTACYQFSKFEHRSRSAHLASFSKTARYWLRENPDPLDEMTKTTTAEMFLHMLHFHVGTSCRLFMTERGYIGSGPGRAEKGDIVCILYGAKVPYVLRKRKQPEDGYVYIGEAYIQGLMDGEFMTSDREPVDFELF